MCRLIEKYNKRYNVIFECIQKTITVFLGLELSFTSQF